MYLIYAYTNMLARHSTHYIALSFLYLWINQVSWHEQYFHKYLQIAGHPTTGILADHLIKTSGASGAVNYQYKRFIFNRASLKSLSSYQNPNNSCTNCFRSFFLCCQWTNVTGKLSTRKPHNNSTSYKVIVDSPITSRWKVCVSLFQCSIEVVARPWSNINDLTLDISPNPVMLMYWCIRGFTNLINSKKCLSHH